jgi:HAD superfamily hydrolase (TIGR01549 family)
VTPPRWRTPRWWRRSAPHPGRARSSLAVKAVKAVVFDVGETLVDETRPWGAWADHLGIPRLTFFAVLGAAIADGRDHRDPIALLRPDVDADAENRRLEAASGGFSFVALDDLYPDALDCLRTLAADGYRLGVAANQPAATAAVIERLGIPLDLVGMSADWGIHKPDPAFFERIALELELPPAAIAYVGDRVDNDVRPAHAAGMTAVFLRRGPWGWIQAGRANPPEADIVIESLAELPEALRRLPR